MIGATFWRTGTKNPHTLYRDEKPAGFALTPELARELVAATRARHALKKLQETRAYTAPEARLAKYEAILDAAVDL